MFISFPKSAHHTYQMRAYVYQARNLYSSDKSGLSSKWPLSVPLTGWLSLLCTQLCTCTWISCTQPCLISLRHLSCQSHTVFKVIAFCLLYLIHIMYACTSLLALNPHIVALNKFSAVYLFHPHITSIIPHLYHHTSHSIILSPLSTDPTPTMLLHPSSSSSSSYTNPLTFILGILIWRFLSC